MERIKAINHTDTQTEIVTPTTEKIVEVKIKTLCKLRVNSNKIISFLCFHLQELNDLYSQALRTKQSGHHERAIELFHKILDYDEIKEVRTTVSILTI